MSDIQSYLTNKYIELGLDTKSKTGFDFNIYPDSGYIPPCRVCKSMVILADKVEAKHMSCGCLWFDYYKNKIQKINPNITFITVRNEMK